MDQREYKDHLDAIKCSDEFRKKMETALSKTPEKNEEYADSVSHVERVKPSVFGRYAAIAAAAVLICGSAGAVWYRASKDKDDHVAAGDIAATSTTEPNDDTSGIFSDIQWMTDSAPIVVSFYTSDGQYPFYVNTEEVDMEPVAEQIKALEWEEDEDFDYTNFYIVGNAVINEKGQLLIGEKVYGGEKVYRTNSAEAITDALYEAVSSSYRFTVNDKVFYRIVHSTKYYTTLEASIDVIYDSPYSENNNILTIDEHGEMELTIDADKVTHEHTSIPSADYETIGINGVYNETINGQTYTETIGHDFEPGLSYTQLINRVLHHMMFEEYTGEFIEKLEDSYFVCDFYSDNGDEIYELTLDPDTGIITEYREYSADKTYISYKLSNIRYTNANGSSNINTDDSGNNTAQNIIRQHIPDGEADIRYSAERRQDYVQPEGTIMKRHISTAELKSLLSSCTWNYISEEFEQKNYYYFEDDYGQLMINEKGQLCWDKYTFSTTDHVDELKEMLRGYFEYEPNSIGDFQKSLIESVSKYDHFTAEGDITFCYDRYIKGIEFEDKCRYEINAPGAEWIVNKNGTGSFSCDNAALDNGSTALSAKVSCEKNCVNLTLTEEGKGIDNFDSVGEITTSDDGTVKRERWFNLTGAPGIETPLPDYQFMVDRVYEVLGECESDNDYEITEENGIRYLKATATHFTMSYSCNVDVIIGIDQNGMLVRFSEKSDEATYYDMTLDDITLS